MVTVPRQRGLAPRRAPRLSFWLPLCGIALARFAGETPGMSFALGRQETRRFIKEKRLSNFLGFSGTCYPFRNPADVADFLSP